MPETSPRQRRREDTLARIEATAMALIVDEGLQAMSIHRLAREVGFTPGALYRYFPSKEHLLATLLCRVIAEFGATLRAHMDAVGGDALARLFAAVEALRHLARAAPHRFGLLALATAEPRVLVPDAAQSAAVMRQLLEATTPLAAAFAQAAKEGALAPGDPTERALIAFTALQGVLSLHKQERHALPVVDVTRLARALITTLLAGWGAAPRDLERALQCALALDPPTAGVL